MFPVLQVQVHNAVLGKKWLENKYIFNDLGF